MKLKRTSCYTSVQNKIEADAKARDLKKRRQLDSALLTAIRFQDTLLARALLETGANPNVKDFNKQTPLGHAVAQHSLRLIDMLLDHGADINLTTIVGTPLLDAIYAEDWPVVEHLLTRGADVNKTGFIPTTALHVAVKHNRDPKLVKTLLEHGARVTAKDAEGLTPLDWARRKADDQIIRELQQATKAKARKERP